MKENLLVTLADKNYIDQAKQLFSSVYWNAGWKGDYMLLAHEIPEKDLKWFRDKGILIKKCKPIYEHKIGIKELRSGTVISKFYLFTLYFKKWKHVIFIESDTIVRASLNRLSKIKGFYATDVSDKPKLLDQISDIRFFNELNKYDLNKPSFNPGVMAFSTNIIKDETFTELKSLFKKYKAISKYGEEFIINVYFYKKWKKLPLIYNLWPHYLDFYYNIKPRNVQAVILHFAGIDDKKELRPWDPFNPFYPEWKSNLEKAELIDLNKIPEGKKWSSFKIYSYSFYLNRKILRKKLPILIEKIVLSKRKIVSWVKYVIGTPDRIIGQIGILIKKHNPDMYYKLKGVKK